MTKVPLKNVKNGHLWFHKYFFSLFPLGDLHIKFPSFMKKIKKKEDGGKVLFNFFAFSPDPASPRRPAQSSQHGRSDAPSPGAPQLPPGNGRTTAAPAGERGEDSALSCIYRSPTHRDASLPRERSALRTHGGRDPPGKGQPTRTVPSPSPTTPKKPPIFNFFGVDFLLNSFFLRYFM